MHTYTIVKLKQLQYHLRRKARQAYDVGVNDVGQHHMSRYDDIEAAIRILQGRRANGSYQYQRARSRRRYRKGAR